ncbi:MAG: hypothetical protein K8S98_10795 [Planctomycetes bacterium]|nr:hypothetical protein [Planctomycetota bacterium]
MEANDESYYDALSADGRFVAYYSDASNLVAHDLNATGDVFVRDLRSNFNVRVSVASDGTEGDGESSVPALSTDGRFVAYESYASNLIAGDTNAEQDVFVHDLATHVTRRVSVASNGAQATGRSFGAALSADGRYVVFQSFAANLVAGDTNGECDVFVRDRVTRSTTRVSVGTGGIEANADSFGGATISADGTRVAFGSNATNFVPGATFQGVYLRDLVSGTTTCVSMDLQGLPAGGGSPAISGNGKVVVYQSGSSQLVAGDSNGVADIFAYDVPAGVTTLVSVDSNGGLANGLSSYLSVSFDGSAVAFGSAATNLVAADTNADKDIFLRDRNTGTTTRVSVDSALLQCDGHCSTPAISADGRFVAFYSGATNLVPGDTNGELDIFVHKRW